MRGLPFLLFLTLAASGAAQEALPQPRIRVGPDILVSAPVPFPQTETTVAAHPTNPKNLIGGAISLNGSDVETRGYVTFDGGSTWKVIQLPGQSRDGGDPQVIFTPRGTAIYNELGTVEERGRVTSPLLFWRSEDGGKMWEKTAEISGFWDHPQLAVDATGGRLYAGVSTGGRDFYILSLFRSDDDGRTFAGPVEVVRDSERGLNLSTPVVLNDGALVFPYQDFEVGSPGGGSARFWSVTSRDGGLTFSEPVLIAEGRNPPGLEGFTSRLSTFPLATGDPTRGWVYFVWTDYASGPARARFSISRDAGKTWSPPREIAPGAPAHAHTFQPAVAVNARGIAGFTWFESRDGKTYDVYFTASPDGGEAFLPPVRLSSETSNPGGAGNLEPNPGAFRSRGIFRLGLSSAFARYPNGGDYVGLAADANGDFHPFWPDARTGRFQIYTSRVRVEDGGKPLPPRPETVQAEIRSRVDVLFDPASYDPATKILSLPVRLKNRSDRPVYSPLQVKVVDFGTSVHGWYKEFTPALLNSSNGRQAAGAVFDFSGLLGDFDALEPGAVTSAFVWKLRLLDPARTPDLHLEIYGGIEK